MDIPRRGVVGSMCLELRKGVWAEEIWESSHSGVNETRPRTTAVQDPREEVIETQTA